MRYAPTWAAALILLASAQPAPARGQAADAYDVLIVAAEETDPRIAQTREAIAFWNGTLEQLGLGARLREVRLLVSPPSRRPLENFARVISLRAGRLAPDRFPPPVPQELTDLGGDVVVLLSRQPLMSFAWPLGETGRYFVGIRGDTGTAARRTRNVIAHELGHTLGLEHNNDPASLMCGGCGTADAQQGAFRHLSAEDRRLLVTRHRAP